MIDTHCHIYLPQFSADISAVISRAEAAGVTEFFLPAIDSSCSASMQNLAETFPGKCFSMAGLHPCSVKENYREELLHVEEILSLQKIYGIGETGLDLYWDKTFLTEQISALEFQAELALKYHLPIILHTRNATQQTIDVIRTFSGRGLRGIFHCFGGSAFEAEQIIDLGFYLGIGGVVTYKNSGLEKVLEKIDLKHFVLETDAPYLTPAPHRGKRNECSYLSFIAAKLAEIKKVTIGEVDEITTNNAKDVFKME